METWDAIRSRRNVRTYQSRPLADGDLERILEAGWRSPSASNRQPWDFVVTTDRATMGELATVWAGARHLAEAAAVIVMTLRPPDEERFVIIDQYDLGQATMAMMLAAADLGIGSGHAAIGDQVACRQILGAAEDRICAYMLALGDPADRPLAPVSHPDRRPINEVVHREHW